MLPDSVPGSAPREMPADISARIACAEERGSPVSATEPEYSNPVRSDQSAGGVWIRSLLMPKAMTP
ncbi:hypothetical protein D3C71_2017810 [compost metagenome]